MFHKGHQRLTTLTYLEPACATHCNTRCTRIDEKGVYAVNENGEEVFFEADTVVLATGFKPNRDLAATFYGTAYDVVPVGDCVKIGNLVGAVRTGFDAGLRL